MARLVPAIDVFVAKISQEVDARHGRQVYAVCASRIATAGHDEFNQGDDT